MGWENGKEDKQTRRHIRVQFRSWIIAKGSRHQEGHLRVFCEQKQAKGDRCIWETSEESLQAFGTQRVAIGFECLRAFRFIDGNEAYSITTHSHKQDIPDCYSISNFDVWSATASARANSWNFSATGAPKPCTIPERSSQNAAVSWHNRNQMAGGFLKYFASREIRLILSRLRSAPGKVKLSFRIVAQLQDLDVIRNRTGELATTNHVISLQWSEWKG